MRQLSSTGYGILAAFEGLRLTAYRDIAGVWTIGYGHTGGVLKGEAITEDQAYRLLAADLRPVENFIEARTDAAATNQYQFDAMVSLTFDIGTRDMLRSSVLRRHKAGDFKGAGAAFLLYDKAHVDGELVEVKGLLNRRKAESALYLTLKAT